MFEARDRLTRERIYLRNALDLVAEKLYLQGYLVVFDGDYLHDVAAHAERGALQVEIAAVVLDLDKPVDQLVPVLSHAFAQRDRHAEIFHRRAQAVNAGHGGDDDDVPALAERTRRRIAQTVDLVVDGHILFDVSVAARDICLGLIIIVIGDEILHSVFGEKFAELVAKLRRQSLVVRDDESGSVQPLDDVRHGEGLAAARDAEQDLGAKSVLHALDEFFYRLRLIAARLVARSQFKHISKEL